MRARRSASSSWITRTRMATPTTRTCTHVRGRCGPDCALSFLSGQNAFFLKQNSLLSSCCKFVAHPVGLARPTGAELYTCKREVRALALPRAFPLEGSWITRTRSFWVRASVHRQNRWHRRARYKSIDNERWV